MKSKSTTLLYNVKDRFGHSGRCCIQQKKLFFQQQVYLKNHNLTKPTTFIRPFVTSSSSSVHNSQNSSKIWKVYLSGKHKTDTK